MARLANHIAIAVIASTKQKSTSGGDFFVIVCQRSFRFQSRPTLLPTVKIARTRQSILNLKCHNCRKQIADAQPIHNDVKMLSASLTIRPKERRIKSPRPRKIRHNPDHADKTEIMALNICAIYCTYWWQDSPCENREVI